MTSPPNFLPSYDDCVAALVPVQPPYRDEACSICQTEWEIANEPNTETDTIEVATTFEDIVRASCSHEFHRSCLMRWIGPHSLYMRTCPRCRTEIYTYGEFESMPLVLPPLRARAGTPHRTVLKPREYLRSLRHPSTAFYYVRRAAQAMVTVSTRTLEHGLNGIDQVDWSFLLEPTFCDNLNPGFRWAPVTPGSSIEEVLAMSIGHSWTWCPTERRGIFSGDTQEIVWRLLHTLQYRSSTAPLSTYLATLAPTEFLGAVRTIVEDLFSVWDAMPSRLDHLRRYDGLDIGGQYLEILFMGGLWRYIRFEPNPAWQTHMISGAMVAVFQSPPESHRGGLMMSWS